MDIEEFEVLFQKRVGKIKPGLENVRLAYEALSCPAKDIPTILVGGTNGKGTTSGFLWGLLSEAGLKVGLYTSPHLIHFRERFQVSGTPVSDAMIRDELHSMRSLLSESCYEELSFFEIATLLSLMLFSRQGCDCIILEIGLGGRLDACNIVEPIASVVTNISKDHEEYLGRDLKQIAFEKFSISREKRPLIWARNGEIMEEAESLRHAEAQLEDFACHAVIRGREFFEKDGYFVLDLEEPVRLKLSLQLANWPKFLQDNLCVALVTYHCLSKELQVEPVESLWKRLPSLARSYSMVARFQELQLENKNRLLLDVCHNLDGARAVVKSLKIKNKKPNALISILSDKDVNGILDILRPACASVVLFAIDDARSLAPKLLAPRHQDIAFYESFLKAWHAVRDLWHNREESWLICGSVLAVGHSLEQLGIDMHEAASQKISL